MLLAHGSTPALRAAAFPNREGLDEFGRRDAAAAKGLLPAASRCVTSPDPAALETAGALGLRATAEPAIRDCDYGTWAGLTLDAVAARDGDAAASWLADPAAAPHGGESFEALLARVADWLAGLRDSEGAMLAITHAAVIRAAVICAIGAPATAFRRLDVAPLSLTRLSGRVGAWTLSSMGERRGPGLR